MLARDQNLIVARTVLQDTGKFAVAFEKPLAKFVSDFTKGYLKAKTTTLSDLRALGDAVGADVMQGLADKLTAKEALAVCKRIDPGAASQAAADADWMRGQLARLLSGEAEPTPVIKPPRATKAPAKKKRSVIDETDAFSAKPRRRSSVG